MDNGRTKSLFFQYCQRVLHFTLLLFLILYSNVLTFTSSPTLRKDETWHWKQCRFFMVAVFHTFFLIQSINPYLHDAMSLNNKVSFICIILLASPQNL